MDTQQAFDKIADSSLFRLNGEDVDLCAALIELCEAIEEEEDTDWGLGEGGDVTLDILLVGAYWALTECHEGQTSESYAAMCAIGSIFSPGMTCAPDTEEPEYWVYTEAIEHLMRAN